MPGLLHRSSNGSGDRGWVWENAKTWLSIARLDYSNKTASFVEETVERRC